MAGLGAAGLPTDRVEADLSAWSMTLSAAKKSSSAPLKVTVSLCPVLVPVTVFPSTTTCCSFLRSLYRRR